MNSRIAVLATFVVVAVSGCAAGIERTAGMKAYTAGEYATAVPLLEAEVKNGQGSARYSLGLAYRDGNGVKPDPVKAEVLLTGAAIGGDPRAVAAVREMLKQQNLCEKDEQLHNLWGSLALNRNIVTGAYELKDAQPRILVRMAEIYQSPCPGRPAQNAAARSLRGLASGPRRIWVYVPAG